eukprot:Awhi_evm2s9675
MFSLFCKVCSFLLLDHALSKSLHRRMAVAEKEFYISNRGQVLDIIGAVAELSQCDLNIQDASRVQQRWRFFDTGLFASESRAYITIRPASNTNLCIATRRVDRHRTFAFSVFHSLFLFPFVSPIFWLII